MRGIDSATLAALSEPVVRMAFLVEVLFPSPNTLRFTTLLRPYTHEGDTYVATGSLGSVTTAASNSQIEPSQYQITLSGIPEDNLAAAGQLDYMNHRATCWALVLDDQDQVVGEPFIWFRGLTDSVDIEIGNSPTIVIQVRDRITDWERPRISHYTDAEQRRLHPGDKGMEFVSQVSSREVEWPAETWFRKNQ